MSLVDDAQGRAAPMDAGERGRYSFLRTSAWARIIAVGVLASLACAALGTWQWNRHSARVAAVERVEENYEAPLVALEDVLPGPSAPLRAQDVWRPVTATGTYAPEGTVLLRNRPVSGQPALHVLSPLLVVTGEGRRAVLVVDRGWVPAGSEEAGGAVPEAPTGVVDVVVRLREPEPPARRTAPEGQAYAISPAEVLAAGGVPDDVAALPVLDAYGVLAAEDPAAAEAPHLLPRPDTDLGTHLSYTLQWWVLSLGALVGIAVLVRREASLAAPGSAAPVQDKARGRRDGRAEREEDALLDQQPGAPTPQDDVFPRGR